MTIKNHYPSILDENDDCIDVVNEMIEDGALEVDGKISEDEFVKSTIRKQCNSICKWDRNWLYIDLDAEPGLFHGTFRRGFVSRSTANIKLKSADSTDNTITDFKHKRQILRKRKERQRKNKYLVNIGAGS